MPLARCLRSLPSALQVGARGMMPSMGRSEALIARRAAYRCFSVAANLTKALRQEIQHEKTSYEQPDLIKNFLKSSEWKFQEPESNVNMVLSKKANGYDITVEFQLASPYAPDWDELQASQPSQEGGKEGQQGESEPPMAAAVTDFTITIEKGGKGEGMTFYCSTYAGKQDYRFLIGNIRFFSNEEEKMSPTSYNGPSFDDLDDRLQEAFDQWLASLGISEEVCDFIDAVAVDKEQREYLRWLEGFGKVLEV
ncbi:unnamed protein product [Vitrella brassicaformis CCMP3155]|uniref:Mitochondrial glycoprotein domain-containing protein n=2 Tax=Vitrella brassicaformis TaxID=1169539 RepID=A0A0G4F287_VITBC|nr:unnamed protein product [Vitrella brassicaformis CCMP3155]|mmetsp:Transcript_36141/g.90175  ORF Transcript_36141/g.90175 Transcript_36141/m.90175 type:complete len:252 (+) Transcript_36141:75-830(+)|eukprot:CEM05651.1 unnamed protein product [Vitrella brassicaformis CCMP3155]